MWHPVSPSMSSMSYQSPDASQNVELKKGNIASFFKTATKRDAKPATQTGDTKRGKAALQQDAASRVTSLGIKAEPAVSHLAHLSTAEASKLSAAEASKSSAAESGRSSAAEANVDLGQVLMPSYKEVQQMQSGQSKGQSSTQNGADVKVEDGVIDLAKDEGNPEAASNDVLNTDDAGGIGMFVTVQSTIDVMSCHLDKLLSGHQIMLAVSVPACAQMQQAALQLDVACSQPSFVFSCCTKHWLRTFLCSRAIAGTAYRQYTTVAVQYSLLHFATMLFAVAKPEPEPGGTRGHLAGPISSKRHAASQHPPEVSTPASKKKKAHKTEQGTIESFFGRKE